MSLNIIIQIIEKKFIYIYLFIYSKTIFFYRLGLHDQEPVQNSEPSPKRATVHPQVVYQMPKSTQVYVNPHLHSNGSGKLQ